jgi:hypothetical protein
MALHHPRHDIDRQERLCSSCITDVVGIVILGDDEAVVVRRPARDSALDFGDQGTLIGSEPFVSFGRAYDSRIAIGASV